MPSQYVPVIQATTSAVSTKAVIENNDAPGVTILANNLAGAETVSIFIDTDGNGTYVAVTDTGGTALTLTATRPALTFEGGPRYAVTKSATAGACAVSYVYSTRGF